MQENLFNEKIHAIASTIAGSLKRHTAITAGIKGSTQRALSITDFVNSLNKRLMPKEGVILSSKTYVYFTQSVPDEMEIQMLGKALKDAGMYISCVFHTIPDTDKKAAMYLVIHRDRQKVLEYRDEIANSLGLKGVQPVAALVNTFIKISEYIGNTAITTDTVTEACKLLKGDEVFCMTVNLFVFEGVNPKDLIEKLSSNSFVVCPLYKEVDENTPEQYKEFERTVGILVSRTQSGVDWAKENISLVAQVCKASEEELLSRKNAEHNNVKH